MYIVLQMNRTQVRIEDDVPVSFTCTCGKNDSRQRGSCVKESTPDGFLPNFVVVRCGCGAEFKADMTKAEICYHDHQKHIRLLGVELWRLATH